MRFLLAALFVSALAACADGAGDAAAKTAQHTVAQAIAGADLLQAGQIARLAEAMVPAGEELMPRSIEADLNEAGTALLGGGQALEKGAAGGADAPAVFQRAVPTLQALAKAYAKAGPAHAAEAGKAAGYLDAFLAAGRFYDRDAPAAGLPPAKLP